jgi:hypothetical protein
MFSDQNHAGKDALKTLVEDDIFQQIQGYSYQMRKKVKVAIIFMFVVSVTCTILATNVWKKDRNN